MCAVEPNSVLSLSRRQHKIHLNLNHLKNGLSGENVIIADFVMKGEFGWTWQW